MIFGFFKKLIKYYIDKLVSWIRIKKLQLEFDDEIKKYHDDMDAKITKPEIVEQKQESPPSTSDIPETTQPEIPEIPKEKETIKLEPCPGKNNQRVGDFRNEKRLERVIGHKRGDDGISPFGHTVYVPRLSDISNDGLRVISRSR